MQLHRDREQFDAAGVRLVVIGQGTPAHALDFRKSQGVDLDMLVDTERAAYRAAGTKIAIPSELLGPAVVAKGIARAAASRVRQGKTVGHNAQLGGVMIVVPDGSVAYVHLADDASDNPPLDEVLAAARAAATPGD